MPDWEKEAGMDGANTMMSVVDGGMPMEFYYDYSYDGIMRSYEDSIQRMGEQCDCVCMCVVEAWVCEYLASF